MPVLLGLILAQLGPAPFYPGEEFVFSVKYGFVGAGDMSIRVVGIEEMDGRTVWHFALRAKGGVPFYRVDDEIHAWADTSTMATVFYKKRIREGSYRDERWIKYDPANRRAYYPDGSEVSTPPGAVDPLTIIYYTRRLPLEVGREFRVPYHVDKRSDWVTVRVVGTERVRVPYGEFDCFIVEPVIPSGKNIFGSKGGMRIWISQDPQHLIVKVSTKVFFGSLTGVLKAKS